MKKIKSGLKKIAKSKAFKIVLGAALIYVGGAALGAWKAGGTLARFNGILVKGGAGAAGGTAASTTAAASNAAAAASIPTGIETITVTAPAAAAGSTVAPTMATAAGTAALTRPTQLPSNMAAPKPATTAEMTANGAQTGPLTVKKGVISRMMEGTANAATKTATWMKDNPLPAAMGMQAIAGALSPDQIEIEQERARLDREEDDRQRAIRNQNLMVGGIDLGKEQPVQPLRYRSTGQPIFQGGVLKRAGVV